MVPSFRSLMRPRGQSFAPAPSAAPAPRRLPQRRQAIAALEDTDREKRRPGFADHGEHALRSLRHQGLGQLRRGSKAESGMGLRRRRAQHHDGSRSAATRPHSVHIDQALKDLSHDMADLREQGPQMAETPCVLKVGHTHNFALERFCRETSLQPKATLIGGFIFKDRMLNLGVFAETVAEILRSM